MTQGSLFSSAVEFWEERRGGWRYAPSAVVKGKFAIITTVKGTHKRVPIANIRTVTAPIKGAQ